MTARPRFKHRGPKIWSLQFCGSEGDWLPACRHYRTLASAMQACNDLNRLDDKWFYRVVQRDRHREGYLQMFSPAFKETLNRRLSGRIATRAAA
jgi:hypothetical protein